MTLVTDRKDLDTTLKSDGQQTDYLVLSEEERAKGFVRPVRTSYKHVGIAGPVHPLRDLSEEEQVRYKHSGYVKFEIYPTNQYPTIGRYWTQEQFDKVGKGCGVVTKMGQALAETYSRNPRFYGSTFCVGCGTHLPVGDEGEFVWQDDSGTRVGT